MKRERGYERMYAKVYAKVYAMVCKGVQRCARCMAPADGA